MNKLWNEFVYGGHLCSLGAPSVVYVAFSLSGLNASWHLLLVLYLMCYVIYLSDRLGDCDSDVNGNRERTAYLSGRCAFARYVLALGIALILALMVSNRRFVAIGYLAGLMLMGLGYGKVFKGLSRFVPGFKDVFVSLAWALLIPFAVVYEGYVWSTSLVLATAFVFLKMLVEVSAFDVKDIKSDRIRGVNTFATLWGAMTLTWVLQVVNTAACLLLLLAVSIRAFPLYGVFLALSLPYASYYLYVLREGTPPTWLYDVYIDAEALLWSVFIVMGRMLMSTLTGMTH